MLVPCQDCGELGVEFDLRPVMPPVRLCMKCFSIVMDLVEERFGMPAAARVTSTIMSKIVMMPDSGSDAEQK